MSVRRISAIFEKDLKDLSKNPMLLIPILIPIIIAVTFDRVTQQDEFPLTAAYMIIGGMFAVVTSGTVLSMMSEENEKKTLRGLIQSPASLFDIVVGKSMVTGIATLVSLIVSILVIGIGAFLNVKMLAALALLFLFFLLLGVSMALFSKSTAATTGLLMPFSFLFGFTPMIGALNIVPADGIAGRALGQFPVMQALELHQGGSWTSLGVMALWTAAAAGIAFLCFRKAMKDH